VSELGALFTALSFIKLVLVDAIEIKRVIGLYTPKIQKVSVTPERYARIITLNSMTYNGTFWKLNITVSAKDAYEIRNDSFNILTPVINVFDFIIPRSIQNPVDATLEVVITNIGNPQSVATLNAGETKTFDIAVYDIYPIIDFDLRPLLVIHGTQSKTDLKWTGSYKCSLHIPTENYVEAKKAYLVSVLNEMLSELANIESKIDETWRKITKALNEWLSDTMPDKLILATLNPALEDYKNLVATAQELSDRIVQFARANDLQIPSNAYKEIYKPPQQLPQLPPRVKLQTRLQQLEADIAKYASILLNDIDLVNQEIIVMRSELERLKSATIQKLSQLGTAYAKATTQVDKQNIFNQKDAVISDYLAKKNEITAKHRQRISELLNKCYSDKDMLDKTMAIYNYLTGNSLIGGDINE